MKPYHLTSRTSRCVTAARLLSAVQGVKFFMNIIYHLKNDRETISALQESMKLEGSIIGLKNTHGLFASGEWWASIEQGKLELKTLKGQISKTWQGHQNDFPEFQVTNELGETTTWPMEKMSLENKVGAEVEIDYVLQEYKTPSDIGTHSECIIEVRLGQ